MFRILRGRVFWVLIVGLVSQPAIASSPWIVAKRKAVVGLTGAYSSANSEYLIDDGKLQRFPLNGQFQSYEMLLSGRYGLGNGVEFGLSTSLKGVSYKSDPVLLPIPPEAGTLETLADYRGRVFDFSSADFRLSDVYIDFAFQQLTFPFHMSHALRLKLPTGYPSPRETFDLTVNSDGSGGSPDPTLILDDVTVGDGQVDLEYMLKNGIFVRKSRTLVELDAGYRVRFNGAGHQALGLVKVGQFINKYLLLIASMDVGWTIFTGEQIGETFVAKDPKQSALEFDPPNNVKRLPYRLDRSYLKATGRLLINAAGREWMIGCSHIFLGENYSKLTSFWIGVITSFGG